MQLGSFFYLCHSILKKQVLLLLLIVFTITACRQNVVINQYHVIPDETWNYEFVIKDTFSIYNPDFYHQTYANLRINGDYPYSNIHLKYTIIAPDSTSKTEKVTIKLAEKDGKWIGTGLGNIITYQTPVLDRDIFKQTGTYTVKLEQYMRLENLPDVISAGIKVEKQEEIF